MEESAANAINLKITGKKIDKFASAFEMFKKQRVATRNKKANKEPNKNNLIEIKRELTIFCCKIYKHSDI